MNIRKALYGTDGYNASVPLTKLSTQVTPYPIACWEQRRWISKILELFYSWRDTKHKDLRVKRSMLALKDMIPYFSSKQWITDNRNQQFTIHLSLRIESIPPKDTKIASLKRSIWILLVHCRHYKSGKQSYGKLNNQIY